MKIEVGMYVRTHVGYIGKIVNINYDNINYLTVDCNMEVRRDFGYPKSWLFLNENNIKNASFHIIDLIEVGDYVNGSYVIQISKESNLIFIETTYYDGLSGEEKHNFIKAGDIKSIVTKEQFESMSYKVSD